MNKNSITVDVPKLRSANAGRKSLLAVGTTAAKIFSVVCLAGIAIVPSLGTLISIQQFLTILCVPVIIAIAFAVFVGLFGEFTFDKKFGKGSSSGFFFGLGLSIMGVICSILGCYTSRIDFECSHSSGKCVEYKRNIFGMIVERKEFGIKQIQDLSLKSNVTRRGFESLSINAAVAGKAFYLPRNESQPVEQQYREFYSFVMNTNSPDYKVTNSQLWMIYLGLPLLFGGLFLLCAALRRPLQSRNSFLPQENLDDNFSIAEELGFGKFRQPNRW